MTDAEAGPPVLSLDWAETGGSGVQASGRRGFGTDVLTEMLAYDLGAAVDLRYEPDGLRCAIRVPLTAQIGRRVAEDPETDWDGDGR
ncbi:two-component sensor histidine kinase [Methylobacterium sp. 1030]